MQRAIIFSPSLVGPLVAGLGLMGDSPGTVDPGTTPNGGKANGAESKCLTDSTGILTVLGTKALHGWTYLWHLSACDAQAGRRLGGGFTGFGARATVAGKHELLQCCRWRAFGYADRRVLGWAGAPVPRWAAPRWIAASPCKSRGMPLRCARARTIWFSSRLHLATCPASWGPTSSTAARQRLAIGAGKLR